MNVKRDMDGKTVVITGATSGIGFAAAKDLSGRGALVIGIGRDAGRCGKARELCGNNALFLTADLSIMGEVRACASSIADILRERGVNSIDVLINNAGTFASYYINTQEGFELQFAVNHLSPFLLTNELMPYLKAAREARVVTVSSNSHYWTRMHWRDPFLRKHYNCLLAYKQSKLANVLFSCELNRRLEGSSVRAFVADPGLVRTEIGLKRSSGLAKMIWRMRMRRGVAPDEASRTLSYLASSPEVMKSNELYYKDCRPKKSSRYSRSKEAAERLWRLSEQLCGIDSRDFGIRGGSLLSRFILANI